MFASLWTWITSTLAGKIIVSCLVSMLPVVELRAGIPIAVGLGLSPKVAIPICVLSNCVPIVPVLMLMRRVLHGLHHRNGVLARFGDWLEGHVNRHRDVLDKYAGFGLFLLTAIPLPGTGAWTASMLASLTQVKVEQAAPAIIAGVLAAGAIVSCVSYGVAALI
jgi:uncharacterized membrane protein